MRIRGLTILLATTIAIGATGCGVAKGPTADGAEPVETTSSESLVIPVGEQVAFWSEGNGSVDGEALRKVKSEGSATLLRTAAARDAFVDSLPAGLDPGELASIDLDTNLLVVGAYPKCMEEARVLPTPHTGASGSTSTSLNATSARCARGRRTPSRCGRSPSPSSATPTPLSSTTRHLTDPSPRGSVGE